MVFDLVFGAKGEYSFPVSFSLKIAYIYEAAFGRPYLQDLASLGQLFTDKPGDSDVAIPIVPMSNIFWAAFKNGAAAKNAQFTHGPEDVAEWLLTYPEIVQTLFNALSASLPAQTPEPPAAAESGEKKMRSTGRK